MASKIAVGKNLLTAVSLAPAAAGDILIVEFGPNRVRAWSVNPASNANVAVPAWQNVNPDLGVTINVTGAKGAYYTVAADADYAYPKQFTGTLGSNGQGGAYASQTPTGFSAPLTLAVTGQTQMPDAPFAYLAPTAPSMAALRLGQVASINSFHQSAISAGLDAQQKLQGAYFTFVDTTSKHAAQKVQLAQQMRNDATALMALAGTASNGTPNGSLIQALADSLSAHGQAAVTNVSSVAASDAAAIPNVSTILDGCGAQAALLQKSAESAGAAATNGFNAEATAAGQDPATTDVDLPEQWSGADPELEGGQAAVLNCYVNAVAQAQGIDASTVPLPTFNQADFEDADTNAQALGQQISAAADAYLATVDPDVTEGKFTLSADQMLGFQLTIMDTLTPVDTTGEIASEESLLGLGVTDNGPQVSDNQAQKRGMSIPLGVGPALAASGGKKSIKACDAGNTFPGISINLLGASFVFGSPWGDNISGASGTDIVFGFGGDDCIKTNDGYDLAFGLKGNDDIFGGDKPDFLFGNSGDDDISGGKGKEYTFTIGVVSFTVPLGNLSDGGAGADSLYGYERGKSADTGYTLQYTNIMFGDGLAKLANSGADNIDGQAGINFIFGQWQDDSLASAKEGHISIDGAPALMGSFFFGSSANDSVTGSNSMDFAFGSKGNDTLSLGDGLDFGFGGAGSDKIDGERGFDILFGNSDDDVLQGGSGASVNMPTIDADLLFGNGGNDVVKDSGGAVQLAFGLTGDDIVNLASGLNMAFGNDGKDVMAGGSDVDILFGNADNDSIDGRNGIDLVFGDTSDDKVAGGIGVIDLVVGGPGKDYLRGGDSIGSSASDGIDILFGRGGSDYIQGDKGTDFAFGGADPDVVHGNAGIDFIVGGDEEKRLGDCLYGDDDPDIILGAGGADYIYGGSGIDILIGNADIDSFWGEGDSNLIVSDNDDEFINVGTGNANLIIGGGGADNITGTGGGLIIAGAGDDKITLPGAPSIVLGGTGNDNITAGDFSVSLGNDGDDNISGGALAFGNSGADQIQNARMGFGGDNNDVVMTKSGGGLAFGQSGDDQIRSAGDVALIFGDTGNDTVTAGAGNSIVFGNSGDDNIDVYSSLQSPDPRDLAIGGPGNNNLYGNKNSPKKRDWLVGGNKTRDQGGPAATSPAAPAAALAAPNTCAATVSWTPQAIAATGAGISFTDALNK